jgi:hypothetical protein
MPGIYVTVADDAELRHCAGIVSAAIKSQVKRAITKPVAGNMMARRAILSELLLGVCNFCYWSGKANNLPAGGSAPLMAEMAYAGVAAVPVDAPWAVVKPAGIANVAARVRASHFPLSVERVNFLYEVYDADDGQLLAFIDQLIAEEPIEEMFSKLLSLFPASFTGDFFLKRALLFFMQLHRQFGLYSRKEIGKLPLPTDYQVPKMLQAYGAISYADGLLKLILAGEILPSGSQEEIEIRAASLLATDRLAEMTGLTTSDIDWALWSTRKDVAGPYHLTVTTDY